jgi:hypothetical protein
MVKLMSPVHTMVASMTAAIIQTSANPDSVDVAPKSSRKLSDMKNPIM